MFSMDPNDLVDCPARTTQHAEAGSIEGTIQRVNYRTRELRLIADGRPWELVLAADCHLWFNGNVAPFRCFQPLDHVWVVYQNDGSVLIAEAIYLWVDEPMFDHGRQNGAYHELDVI